MHRDLKPANIFLLPSGRVKLMDFGIARGGQIERTRTGLTPGTPSYMAPEQLSGQPVTAAADIHAFGLVLFELLTGESCIGRRRRRSRRVRCAAPTCRSR